SSDASASSCGPSNRTYRSRPSSTATPRSPIGVATLVHRIRQVCPRAVPTGRRQLARPPRRIGPEVAPGPVEGEGPRGGGRDDAHALGADPLRLGGTPEHTGALGELVLVLPSPRAVRLDPDVQRVVLGVGAGQ